MKLLSLLFFCLSFSTAVLADCFPIRRIMDADVTRDFNRLCRAAVGCDPACKNIEPSKMINCSASQSANSLFATDDLGRRLLHCARAFFIDSMVDLANTIIELIKTLVGSAISGVTNIIKFMTDSNFRNQTLGRGSQMSALGTSFIAGAARNFSREYAANFKEAVGKVGLLNAPLAALGDTLIKPFLKMVTDTIGQIVESQISQFKCLNSKAKQEALCSLVGGFLMPPAVFFKLLKGGMAAIKGIKGAEGYLTAARRTFTAVTRPRAAGVALRTAEGAGARTAGRLGGEALTTTGTASRVGRTATTTSRTATTTTRAVTTTETASTVAASSTSKIEFFRRMSGLTDDARILEAERSLGRTLTEAEREAILDAHYVGLKGPDGKLLPAAQQSGFGKYTLAEIRQKSLILQRAGFSRQQIRELMEQGIAGGFGGLEATLAEVAEATARREAILAGNADELVMNGTANARGTMTYAASERLNELYLESYAAARGNLRVAYETTGEVSVDAARRALEAATTSGDPSLILEASELFKSRGGDLGQLLKNNDGVLEGLKKKLLEQPNNRALKDEIYSRETLARRYPEFAPPKPVEAPTPTPAVATPKPSPLKQPFNSATGQFASTEVRNTYNRSILSSGTEAKEVLNTAAKSDNLPLFVTVNDTFKTYFNEFGWPKKINSVGVEVKALNPQEELRSLKALRQNFFEAQVTNGQGFTQTFAQEYRSRAWGGNLANFDRVQRNLLERIKQLESGKP